MNKNESMERNIKLYQEEFTAFTEKDLSKFENCNELIASIKSIAHQRFSELTPEYEAICHDFEDKQREILALAKDNHEMLVWSINVNSSYRKSMKEKDKMVMSMIAEAIPMETALGKIFLEAILRKSQLQWQKEVLCSEENFTFVQTLKPGKIQKLQKFFFESYDKGRSLKVDTGKNYNEAVATASMLLPNNLGGKIYEILLIDEIRDYVKDHKEAMEAALNFIPQKYKEIIRYYLGMDPIYKADFDGIASILHFSTHKVARLFDEGIKKIKWKSETEPELMIWF